MPIPPPHDMPAGSLSASPSASGEAPATFPDGFLWGAATSAYQIEGGVDVDGRGESVWDVFARVPGSIADGSTGDVAADHRHRFADDVGLMAGLGLGAYRFSISWPRIQPGGRGPANGRGLDFYDRLVDALLDHGIEPVVTLFHWDLPVELQTEGGWANRDTAKWFAEYATIVYERLHDRVGAWVTVNEPRTYAFVGHALGAHAPGVTSYRVACAVAHHLLLGHGWATEAMRAIDGSSRFGLAPDPAPVIGRGEREEDHDAVRRVDGLVNRLFLDPVLLGRYPADVREDLAPFLDDDVVRDGDEASIGVPIDLLGVNYYRPYLVAAGDPQPSQPPSLWPRAEHVEFLTTGGEQTDNGWDVYAQGLSDLLVTLTRDYPAVPLYITENGAAYNDELRDGTVDDARRIRYLHEHLQAVHRAILDGADVRGYFVWSLLDNFEWERGYTQRFGLVHVDFDTLERTPKASALWYRDVAAANRLPALRMEAH